MKNFAWWFGKVFTIRIFDGWEKFERASLPPKDAFYSRLNIFLETYVLLLADVFETFRNTCLRNYKLDPAHFYTASGLAWQALLKTTVQYCEHEKRRKDCELCPNKFRLELLTDIDMLLMVERSIRGEITQAIKHYARANNKYMKKLYNHISSVLGCKQPLRMSNSSKLPTHWFLWKDAEDFTPEKIDELVKKTREYIF